MLWINIMLMASITFFNRYAFFARQLSFQPSLRMKRFLSYSTYSVLTAIWAPIVFTADADLRFSHAGIDYLIATSLAAALSVARVPMIITVILSSAVFFTLRLAILPK